MFTAKYLKHAAWVALLPSLLGLGCGPVISGVNIINANVRISAAETAGAKEHALYEYTSAVEYLQKAREEAGYSDFAAARLYADKAEEMAKRALQKAETASKLQQPAVLPPPQ